MACLYFIAQMFGAFMGYGLLLVITPSHIFSPDNDVIGVCVTRPIESLTPIQAVAIEYLSTTILIALCCGCWDPRNASLQDTIPLKFGFALVAIGCVVVSEFVWKIFHRMQAFNTNFFVAHLGSIHRRKHESSTLIWTGSVELWFHIALGTYRTSDANPIDSNKLFISQIYWAGPLPAGLITAVAYKTVFRREVGGKASLLTNEDRKVNRNDNIPLKNVV